MSISTSRMWLSAFQKAIKPRALTICKTKKPKQEVLLTKKTDQGCKI